METPSKSFHLPPPHLLQTPVKRLLQQNSDMAETPRRRSLTETPRWSALTETPIGAHLIETSETPRRTPGAATPRRALIKQTERAIEQYLKDDCETNLPMINTLENISYQLWVESNTAFLDESVVSDVIEDEEWQWDEECFYASVPSTFEQPSHQTDCDDSDSINTSNSSLCSSIKPCDETDCYFGYLASSEWEDSDSSTETDSDSEINNLLDDWVIISDNIHQDNSEHTDENDWIVLSTSQASKPIEIQKTNRIEQHQGQSSRSKEQFTSSLMDIENTSDSVDFDGTLAETFEDWAILSVKVTEFCVRRRKERHEQSLDSGIKSPDTSGATSLLNCSHNSRVHASSGAMCLHGVIRSFVQYLLPFLYSPTSFKTKENCCDCCGAGKISVLDILQLILTELYRT